MYDFWQDNYEWLLSGIIPTLITAIFAIIKYRKNKRNKDVSQEKNIQTNTIYANNNSGHITRISILETRRIPLKGDIRMPLKS